MNFGERLKALRIYHGYTQEELAAKIGTKKQTISRYENSEREPNLKAAKKIANALGVSLEELTPDEDTNKKIAARNGDEEVDPIIIDLITKLEESPLSVRNAAIAAAFAVLKSDLLQK